MSQARPPKKQPGAARKIAKAARAALAGVALAGMATGAGAPPSEPAHNAPFQNPTEFLKTSAGNAVDEAAPVVLLGYQQEWIADQAQLKVGEKGRRVGLTWAEAADDVLIAAAENGSNVFYISATQDMAREYIEACAMWARHFSQAASEVSEGIFEDEGPNGEARHIKTFEVTFPGSGKRIVALSSRPTNLRGKQGVVVIDEAAFAGDLKALLKAAMAMLMWGDKVRIISTHFGIENSFKALIDDIRAGKRGDATQASVHTISFQRAIADGLYRRVCLRKGIDWTKEAEDKWVAAAYKFYGDDAAEELDVVPSQGGGRYLSLALIEQRSTSVKSEAGGPALERGAWKDEFAWLAEEVRHHAVLGWLRENIDPVLERLNPALRHCFGMDFARNRNLSSITVLEEGVDLVKRVRLQLELFNCPFTCQEQILFYIIDRLPRFRGGAMDANGNGSALAEKTAQRYGTQMIERVMLNNSVYLNQMPKLKAALEDGTLTDIPRDDQLRDDLRAIQQIDGVPKVPRGDSAQSTGAKAAAKAEAGTKMQRHGDFAISLMLAVYAFFREAGEIDFTPGPAKHGSEGSDERRGSMRSNAAADDLASAVSAYDRGW